MSNSPTTPVVRSDDADDSADEDGDDLPIYRWRLLMCVLCPKRALAFMCWCLCVKLAHRRRTNTRRTKQMTLLLFSVDAIAVALALLFHCIARATQLTIALGG